MLGPGPSRRGGGQRAETRACLPETSPRWAVRERAKTWWARALGLEGSKWRSNKNLMAAQEVAGSPCPLCSQEGAQGRNRGFRGHRSQEGQEREPPEPHTHRRSRSQTEEEPGPVAGH